MARRVFFAFLILYVVFAWPIPDPIAGRQLALAEAFSHGRVRAEGVELQLPGGGDFAFPDGADGGGVPIFGIGSSLAAAPFCFATQAVLGTGEHGTERRQLVVFVELCFYVFLIALAAAATVSLLGRLLVALELPYPWHVAILYGLMLPLATTSTVNPHVPATLCAAAGLLLLLKPGRTTGAALGAGLAIGGGALCDLTFILPVAIPVGIYALVTGNRRTNLAFVGGATLPAVVFLAWNTVSFGAPWRPGPRPEDMQLGSGVRYDMERGYFGLLSPGAIRGRVLFELLFGDRVGLFCFVPALVMGVLALPALAKKHRGLTWLIVAVTVLAVLQIATKEFGWYGGNSTGPRYLFTVILFLTLPLGLALRRWPRVTIAAIALSVAIAWIEVQTPTYGSLRSSVVDLFTFGPQLRGVLSLAHTASPGIDASAWLWLVSSAIAIPGLAVFARLIVRDPTWRGSVTLALVFAWCLPLVVVAARGGPGSATRSTIRVAELERFIQEEPFGLRLDWYGHQLLGHGRPDLAAEAFLRGIELEGWGERASSLAGLRRAVVALDAQGRKDLVVAFLRRADALKKDRSE